MKSLAPIIMLTLCAGRARAAGTCPATLPAGDWPEISAHYASARAAFALLPQVSQEADRVLRQLAAQNSPTLESWIRKRGVALKSKDDLTREWRLFYAQNFVLARYPVADVSINQAIEQLMQTEYAHALDPAFRKKLEDRLSEAQTLAQAVIGALNLPEEDRTRMKAQIRKVRLYWMGELKTSKFKTHPLEAMAWGVAYDPVTEQINVGIEARKYGDLDSTLIAVLAHELGHSLDSCHWGHSVGEKYPFAAVVVCLRTDSSVGAKRRDDSPLAALVAQGAVSPSMALSLRQNPTCNTAVYPPLGVQADQSLESFADWFAAEVLSWRVAPDPMIRPDLCAEQVLNEGSAYPPNRSRRDRIYLAQPKLRAQAGLKEVGAPRYCPAP